MLIPAEYDGKTASPKKHRVALVVAAAAIAARVSLAVSAVGHGSSDAKQPADDPAVFLRGIVSRIAGNDYDTV